MVMVRMIYCLYYSVACYLDELSHLTFEYPNLSSLGTHVAGTIAAYDNEIGVVGVAAGAAVVSVR